MTSVLHSGALLSRGTPPFREMSSDEIDNIRHYIREKACAAAAASK